MDRLCEERHERIDARLAEHDKVLEEHGKELATLTTDTAVHTTQIDKLCEEIKSLVATIKWFIGIIGASFVGFFFYAVQQHLFK